MNRDLREPGVDAFETQRARSNQCNVLLDPWAGSAP